MTLATWMGANLETQGYRLADDERRALWLGLRFSTGVCLALSATALALQSGPACAALAAIGAVAGFSSSHPFDHLWNGGVRHLLGAPSLPASPPRRRHAFKVATVMLATVAALFFAGAATAALVVGAFLLVACAAVTATNFCIPSVALSLIDRRRARQVQPVT